MNNRRTFLKKAIAGVSLAGLFPFIKKANAGEIKISDCLIHHVYFWLKEPDNLKAKKQIEQGMKSLLQIETIQLSHIGIPAETENRDVVENSYTYSYMVMFKDKDAHDFYQEHPIHLKFIEENSHLWEKVIVYDSAG